MESHVIVGGALVAAGAIDVVIALTLIRARVTGPQRTIVVGAVASGGVMMMLLGGAFAAGLLPLG